MDPVFRSKIDLWLVAAMVGIPLAVLFILPDSSADQGGAALLALVIVGVVLAFFAWLCFSTSYTITPQALHITSGPFSWNIPLKEISSIEPTRNPASSPALSLDRLLIRYGGGEALMVSPADKEGFMMELAKRSTDKIIAS